jgi:hypothetical protein
MFQSNNPAIDTNILAKRVRGALAGARPISPERPSEATHVKARVSFNMKLTEIGFRARNWLKPIPILGDALVWGSWVIRIRKIVRMAFDLEENLSQTRLELEHLNQKFRGFEEILETNLQTFFVTSRDNSRAIEALRADFESLQAENKSLRQEIILQQRKLSGGEMT